MTWPWLLCFALTGCGVPTAAGPIIADQGFIDAYEENAMDAQRAQREALLQLCMDGYDLACVRVRDEGIAEYLRQ